MRDFCKIVQLRKIIFGNTHLFFFPDQLQTDAEKRSAIGCNSIWNDDLRRPDGCSDPGIEMETSSKWCNPSDFSDESERSLTGRKAHGISQTGSWRRGMGAQLGITCPRTKTLNATNCSPLKIHSNGWYINYIKQLWLTDDRCKIVSRCWNIIQ